MSFKVIAKLESYVNNRSGKAMKSLIRFGIEQGVLVNTVFVGLIIFSAVLAVPNISIDRYPNIQFGEVQVSTVYPGASPDEVERLVTDVIEESLRGMEQIEFVRSTSIERLSHIHVKFEDDTDYDRLYDELRFRVLGVQNQLPVVNGDRLLPVFDEQDVDEWLPVIQVNLVAKNKDTPLSVRSLTLLAKDLRVRLQQIDGVKEVMLLGNDPEQFVIALDPERLEHHRVTMRDVVSALRSSGMAPPAGSVDTTEGERLIRVDTRYRSRQGILNTVIRRDGDGNLITVADIVDHRETGINSIRGAVFSSVNGLDTVACRVLKHNTANVIEIKEQIDNVVNEFLHANETMNVQAVMTLDSSIKIRDGLGVLVDSLMLSVIFVMLLLFLFMATVNRSITATGLILGIVAALIVGTVQDGWVRGIAIAVLTIFVFWSCRTAVLTVSGIVFSFLVSLLIFYFAKQSINEISLLGFVIVSGIVVDDAIVVIENIQRHREEGQTLIAAVVDGAAEVFWPIVSATLTTIAAFLPMLLMTGSTGDFFALVPISVTSALGISLFECLFILPLHVVELERILGRDRTEVGSKVESSEAPSDQKMMGRLSRKYDRMLRWTVGHPLTTIGVSVLLFFLAVLVLVAPYLGLPPILKLVFFPDDTSIVTVTVRMPPDTPLRQTDSTIRRIARDLISRGPEEVRNVDGSAGMIVDLTYNPVWSNQYGFLTVELPSRDQRSFRDPKEFISRLRSDLEAKFERDGIDIEVTAAQDGPPVGQPVNVRVTGIEDEAVLEMTEDLIQFLREKAKPGGSLDGVIDLAHDRTLFSTVVSFTPTRQRVSLYGLRDQETQQFIADALDGAYVGDFRRVDSDIPIRVRLAKSTVKDPLDLLSVPITNDSTGRVVRFNDIGKLTVMREPATLIKRDFQRTITITGNIREESRIGSANVVAVVSKWIKQNAANYPGVTIGFGGEAESTAKSYRSLFTAFAVSILLIYTILASQFRSYIQPFLIMSNIIFSFTGVVLAMAIFGLAAQALPNGWVRDERSYFTVQGFIAIVGLTGLVVNDAIVLINFINKRIEEGLSLNDAILTAGHQRMRPIVMTTATTIAGLLPMAIGIPDFSITWGPFATCFIAGLFVSTSMTLLVVPVLYLVLERYRHPTTWPLASILTRRQVHPDTCTARSSYGDDDRLPAHPE